MANLIPVGYWDNKNKPYKQVVSKWDDLERQTVISYLESGEVEKRWRGSSTCRFCKILNGSTCKTDGVYIWPEGYAHYLEEHNVKPPSDFVQHILSSKTFSSHSSSLRAHVSRRRQKSRI